MTLVLEDIQKQKNSNLVPKGWSITSLKHLSLLKISNGAFNDPKNVGSGYKLINVVDLYQGSKIRTEKLGRLILEKSEYETFRVQPGDLFFTRSSLKKEGIAHCNIFLSDEDGVVYECHMMRVRPNPESVDSKYLQEFCLSGPAREYFISHGKTTTMTTIDQGSIGGLPVLLPPLPEQKKIAAVFTAVDDKLDVIARQIAATETLKQGLMQTLFSRGAGTKDANGRWVPHTAFKKSELDNIPETWEVKLLGELAQESRQRNSGALDDKLLCGVLKSQGLVPMRERVKGASTERCRVVVPDAFAYNPMRINIGSIARNRYKHAVMVSPDYVVFSTAPSLLSSDYLDHFRNSNKWASFVGHSGDGGVRIRIYFDHLSRMLIPTPPMEEQRRIVDILDGIDAKLDSLSQKQAHYQALKRGLMQKLLTGEWRVKLNDVALAA